MFSEGTCGLLVWNGSGIHGSKANSQGKESVEESSQGWLEHGGQVHLELSAITIDFFIVMEYVYN